jgi:DNA-binding winged helix-turn-helix (wHTH) protein/predicted ATPase
MSPTPQWIFEPFRVDPANACLWRGDQMISLRPKVFAVLSHLVARAGQLVTKEALFEAVWPETAVTDVVLKACIREVRQALGDMAQSPRFIATVHRRGYRFIAPVTMEPYADAGQPAADGGRQWPRSRDQKLTAVDSQPASPIVEREGVLQQLRAGLEEASQGRRRVIFLSGEPGIGKTAVVEAFAAEIAYDRQVRIVWGQCVEHFGAGEAYMPVLEALGQLCKGTDGSRIAALLRQHAPTWLVQMPWLLNPADRIVLQHELSGATRERMLREFVEALDVITAEVLLVLVFEDLHWSDHSSLDLLAALARHRAPSRLLVLGTYRPVEAIVHDHPLHTVKQDLQLHRQCRELPLTPLSEAAVGEYLEGRFPGCVFPEALTQHLFRRTDGNPLFLVNVVAHLVAQGLLVEHDGHWSLRGDAVDITMEVPESLRHMIAQQFERLPPEEQQLVGAGSVAGIEFTAAGVAASLARQVEQVEAHCEALARRGQMLRPAGIVEWPDGTITARYAFQHALYQQVAYERMGQVRRLQLHLRLGERLEAAYGARAPEVAAELARHFVRGLDRSRAVQYLRQAAEIALGRHAHREAIDYLHRGLRALQALPDVPARRQQELLVYLALGAPLMATRGQAAPEVESVYAQAYALCQQVEQTAQLLPVLAGLRRFYVVRGAHEAAWELAERLLTLAQRLDDRTYQLEAHRALGTTLFFRGQLPAALAHLQQAMALYAPAPPQVSHVLGDPQVSCLIYAARALWCLGYPDQSRARSQQALALAQRLSHPYNLVWSQSFIADLYHLRGEDDVALTLIEASLIRASEQGLPYWEARGHVMRGLLLAKRGRTQEGIVQMRQGLAAMQTTGAELNRAYFLAQLAEAHARAGEPNAGLDAVTEAFELVERGGERWWEAELHRLRGELLWGSTDRNDRAQSHTPRASEAEGCLQQALTIARQQQVRALELRAAVSLGRLWRSQGRGAKARQLLIEVYNWFTEGFDTADLQAAKALLDELP